MAEEMPLNSSVPIIPNDTLLALAPSPSSPSAAKPNQTSDPPTPSTPSSPSNSSVPPPRSAESPPPPKSTASPPSPPLSPPPEPGTQPLAPPPSPPLSPPPSPTPPPSTAPPRPPAESSPPPETSPPPRPPSGPSPPQSSPPRPSTTLPPPAPPPPEAAPSPPSPNASPPPTTAPSRPTSSPPPPLAKPPKNSPTPPRSPSSPPPSITSPPPPGSNSSLPGFDSPSAPPSNSNSSVGGRPSPLPSLPTEKPTAKETAPGTSGGTNATVNSHNGISAGPAAAIGIVVFFAICLVIMAVWFARKRKKGASTWNGGYIMPSPFFSSQASDSSLIRPQNSAHLDGSASGNNFMYSPEHCGVGNSRSWFGYEELAKATNGFSAQNLLGEGGFGCVYKGFLGDGREVAVKQLKIGGGQGEREFRAEVEIISRIHHRHLVSLVGYCISENQRLLVYDYVPNNTLHYHLHGQGRPVMEWTTRVKVAAGAARGISYLHEDCHPRIIHRDIKSSNILLNYNFEAKVADFGLAKFTVDANTHVTTRVMGTFGYMAPEYASTGKLTDKSDVFSFGVVLLELITGRKPVDASQPLGDESLVEWARPLLTKALETETFEELIDPRLERNYVESEMFRMIEAAAACTRHLAAKRPRMSQVVRALDSIVDLSDLSNGMRPGQSEIFDSREQSAQIRMFQRMAFGSQDYSSEFFDRSHGSWKSSNSGYNY